MKTEDLIADLSKDAAATPLRPLRIGAALSGVIILCAAAFLAAIVGQTNSLTPFEEVLEVSRVAIEMAAQA